MTPAHRHVPASLRSGQIKPASATRMVATLPAPASRPLPDGAPRSLSATLERSCRRSNRLEVPSTIVHGDFAPWNLRTHHGKISAFDWEYGELDGLPLMDETHYHAAARLPAG